MTHDLSTADQRQLEVWAFGRQASDDPARAEAAQRDLARRAEITRAEATVAAAQASADTSADVGGAEKGGDLDGADVIGGDAGSGEAGGDAAHPESSATAPEHANHRRMLVTGIAGLIAATLGLGAVGTALSVPDPDPLALFERQQTPEDRDWETRLTQAYVVAITQGPRVVDVADGVIAVAFRSAAVADGRSTEYDPYCLFMSEQSDDGTPISVGGACVLPAQFAVEGISVPLRESASGAGLDSVRWGPTGTPVFDSGTAYGEIGGVTSALDWMVFPSFAVSGADAVAMVNDPERLLLGPTLVPMSLDDEAAAAIITSVYLLRGKSADAGPVLCAHATVPVVGDTTSCAPLSAVRRQGLEFTVTTTDREWVVRIGADGPNRSDTVRAAN